MNLYNNYFSNTIQMYPSNDRLAKILQDLSMRARPGDRLLDNRVFARIREVLKFTVFAELNVSHLDVANFATTHENHLVLSQHNLSIRWKHADQRTSPLPLICYRAPHNSRREVPHLGGSFY